MNLFDTPVTTPNDREWLQIRGSLESRIKAAEKAKDEKALIELRADYQDHIRARSKYEAAGKQQLSLF